MIIRRYEAMQFIAAAQQAGGGFGQDEFERTEAGYNCLAQYLASAITLGAFGKGMSGARCGHRRRSQPEQASASRFSARGRSVMRRLHWWAAGRDARRDTAARCGEPMSDGRHGCVLCDDGVLFLLVATSGWLLIAFVAWLFTRANRLLA